MNDLIHHIVETEWEMFHSTHNVGGPASCQNDRRQFEIMRRSQFLSWNETLLVSYLKDLEKAKSNHQNLVTLKYAYMMEHTSPEEYAHLAPCLPPLSAEKEALIHTLVSQTVAWGEEFASQYPNLARQGRPIHSYDDTSFTVSVETYSRGEFMTYGIETLQLLVDYYAALAAAGRNLHLEVLENELHLSGLSSLEETERFFAAAH